MLEDMRRAGDAAAQARTAEDERAARERAQQQMAAMHLASAGPAGAPPHAGAPPQGYGGPPPHGAPVRMRPDRPCLQEVCRMYSVVCCEACKVCFYNMGCTNRRP